MGTALAVMYAIGSDWWSGDCIGCNAWDRIRTGGGRGRIAALERDVEARYGQEMHWTCCNGSVARGAGHGTKEWLECLDTRTSRRNIMTRCSYTT